MCKISHKKAYRSRQYYESKVHNTEVMWFSTFHGSLKTVYFDIKKTLAEFLCPIQNASLTPSKQNPRLFTPQSTFESPREFWFQSILKLNGSKLEL